MTKEKEIKEVTNDIQSEKFILTDKTRSNGYTCNSPHKGLDIRIDFQRDYDGKRISRYASTGKIVNGEFKSDEVDFITGLNHYQMYVLAIAGVIKLKKAQKKYFHEYLKEQKSKLVDDDE